MKGYGGGIKLSRSRRDHQQLVHETQLQRPPSSARDYQPDDARRALHGIISSIAFYLGLSCIELDLRGHNSGTIAGTRPLLGKY